MASRLSSAESFPHSESVAKADGIVDTTVLPRGEATTGRRYDDLPGEAIASYALVISVSKSRVKPSVSNSGSRERSRTR
jgi:hypothetical protein